MRIARLFTIITVLGLAVTLVGPAAAQEELPACSGANVSGAVVAVDEATGLVTIATDGGALCTVVLSGEYDHPIVSLLGAYFGDVSVESLAAALETTQVWVVCEEGTCALAEGGSEGAVAAIIVGITENEDGTFTLELMTEDSETPIEVVIDDPDQAGAVTEALESLVVDWELQIGEDGSVGILDVGDAIAAYHEDGLGFGVLVKLYAIAAEAQEACEGEGTEGACDVNIEALVSAFQSGTGMGELFQQYGRPSITGVGHVRHADRDSGQLEDGGRIRGVCNARSHGGRANATGHGQGTRPAPPPGPGPGGRG